MQIFNFQELVKLTTKSLMDGGCREEAAEATAYALVLAEAQGIGTHGLSRVAQYKAHLKNNRVNLDAVPQIVKDNQACSLIDACSGLAFEACKLAIDKGMEKARQYGVSISSVTNSHHAGVMVDHLRPLVEHGFIGSSFSNVPAIMPVAGGKRPLLGTNPIAAIFPRKDKSPLMIDMSLSEITRGKLAQAAKKDESIPLGWALDREGEPTTSAKEGMNGSMLAFGSGGGTKGATLALLVELLVTVIVGANFSFEASSFFVEEGNKPKLGQTFIIINPEFLIGSENYFYRIEQIIEEMLLEEGVRIPGLRREELLKKALKNGIEVSEELLQTIC